MDMGRLVLDYNLDFANGLTLAVILVALNSLPVRYIIALQSGSHIYSKIVYSQ